MYKLVGTQLSLLITVRLLFFQFVFILPARCVRMGNFTGKSKQMQAVYIILFSARLWIFVFFSFRKPASFFPAFQNKQT